MVINNIVTELEILPSLGNGSPASCRIHPNGKCRLRIGLDLFSKFPFESKMFILFHEIGHAVNQSANEFDADKYALKQYVRAGLPLDKAIIAMTRTLNPETNIEQSDRIRMHFLRVKKIAYLKGKISFVKFIN